MTESDTAYRRRSLGRPESLRGAARQAITSSSYRFVVFRLLMFATIVEHRRVIPYRDLIIETIIANHRRAYVSCFRYLLAVQINLLLARVGTQEIHLREKPERSRSRK
jgi:hypothetical protein